jgi:carbonic anhydrase
MNAEETVNDLLEGNRRFIEGRNQLRTYTESELSQLSESQTPKAAIIACSDSRVVPEVMFDQPLGSLFVSRVPGNVASDGTKWMIDIAVGEFKVPLILVLAHTGCLAVRQIVEGKDGPGGSLRFRVQAAFHDVALRGRDNLYERTIDQNARKTVADLVAESDVLADAVRAKKIEIRAARYDMPSGKVVML